MGFAPEHFSQVGPPIVNKPRLSSAYSVLAAALGGEK